MRKTVLLFALALLSFNVAQSQENIVELPFYDDGTSIVRYVDNDHWLVYSYSKRNMFYMMSPGATNVPFLIIQSADIHILDFEVFNNTVYFCGYATLVNGNTGGVMGYFDVNQFPNVNIMYNISNEFSSFKRLDVFDDGDKKHVVMTSDKTLPRGTMTDAIWDGVYTWTYYSANIGDTNIFYDVAVTDKNVVFSSRKDVLTGSFPQLWYTRKPYYPGNTIFVSPSTTYRITFTDKTTSFIHMDHLYSNKYAVYYCITGSLIHNFAKINGIYPFQSLKFANRNISVQEIKYCPADSVLDVLANNPSLAPVRSYMYHLYTNSFLFGGNANYHIFNSNIINSIDYFRPSSSLTFVASGFENGSNDLHVLRYTLGSWGVCSSNDVILTNSISTPINYYNLEIPVIIKTKEFVNLPYEPGSIRIETLCGQ